MNDKVKKSKYKKFIETIGTGFAIIMLSFFPIFITDKYFNIRHDKLYAFYVLCGALVMVSAVILLCFNNRKSHIKEAFCHLSIVDWAVIGFAFFSTVSTLISDYFSESLTGNVGRNNGLTLTLMYAVMYFIISRTYKNTFVVPLVLSVTSAVVSFIAILQQFYWDPLNLYQGLSSVQYKRFLSTIGNRNLLSAYLCIMVPVCLMMFIYATKNREKILYAVTTMINFGGMICCNSDSCILGMSALIILLYILFIRTPQKLSRMLFISFLMLLSCKLIRLFSYIMEDYSMRFSSIQKILVYGNTYFIMGIILALSLAVLIFSAKKPNILLPKGLQIGVIVLFLSFGVAIIIGVVYFSAVNTNYKLTGAMKYLRFNDKWGTHRGFMWIRSLYIFKDMSVFHQIFGSGPDTFGIMMDISGFNRELSAFKNEVTNCAHNVYLNYLITIGVTGAVSYTTMVVASIVRGIKNMHINKYSLIFASAVLCYGVQSIVNIDQPITTPFFILMIAIVESQNRCIKG